MIVTDEMAGRAWHSWHDDESAGIDAARRAIEAALSAAPVAPIHAGRTVDVRVAVAVDATSRWAAHGHRSITDKTACNCARIVVGDDYPIAVHILTATLAVPAVAEVAARVESVGHA